ncbi:MAG: HprK-related kinase A [Sedimenticola sp.]
MKISDFSPEGISRTVQGQGLFLQIGPFSVRVKSPIPSVSENLALLYSDYPGGEESDFADFHIQLTTPSLLRRLVKPQVTFSVDHVSPFLPLPIQQAFPLFEWGLNWCIGTRAHQYLIVHAAVIEKNGCAAILPAPPGAGKSTLCAGLVNRGWRLLSDELALIGPDSMSLTSVPRPVSLKNESIAVIGEFAPEAVITSAVDDTSKGTVAHMKAPTQSVQRSSDTAEPVWVIFPKYVADAPAVLASRPKGRSFMEIAGQSFNYNVLGTDGFEIMKRLIDHCHCFDFSYGSLDEAVEVFDQLPGLNGSGGA